MTGTMELQNLIRSIVYEVKTVLRDDTLSLYYKIAFSILKILCVCGFNLGRTYPEKRNRNPLLPPPIPTFSSLQNDVLEGATDSAVHQQGENKPSEAEKETDSSAVQSCDSKTHDSPGFNELTTESAAAVEQSDFRPTVVVVIPVYVRTLQQRKEVLELVTSLANQTYKPAQVLLVDDASPLQWYNIGTSVMPAQCGGEKQAEEVAASVKLPEGFKLIKCPKNHGPAAARSLGLGLAMTEHQAQIVNFIDSDCEADIHWVEAMVKAHYKELVKSKTSAEGTMIGAILSGVTYAYGNTAVDKFHDHYGTLNGRIKINGEGLLYGPSCNISIRICKKLISEVGGFDESFPKAAFEDVDFCVRANKCGILTQCAKDAKVWHKYGVSLPQLFRMFQRYGASEWAVLERHPEYMELYGASYHIPAQAPKVVT
ncbi:unnamed protein product [Sphagnum balticum]